MSQASPRFRTATGIASLGVLAFLLLAGRFSPNWMAFAASLREAWADVPAPQHRDAVERAIYSGHSERGLHVLRQARDLSAEIEPAIHKIVRWRLLVPAVAHGLSLPDGLTLGLAHVGCLVLVLVLVAIGLKRPAPARPAIEALGLGLIAGASAPFFTSMGWVGYYDSLLALGLLAVAFARNRWVVAVACVLAPWIDERFVIGLPLALCVRWQRDQPTSESAWAWCRREGLLPVALVAGYALVRLRLGGAGGSQTVVGYLEEFVFSSRIPIGQRLFGAWSGLRLGWLLVGTALAAAWFATTAGRRWPAIVLAAATVGTAVVGLVTALDMSRSMVLVLPVVPLGWQHAVRMAWWRKYRAGPAAAALALALPAHHVVAHASLPVDNLWSYSLPLMTAENNLGLMFATGNGVPRDGAKAARWLRKPADRGVAVAQNNLGLLYAMGDGVTPDAAEAARWFARAADQGVTLAQENLGVLYANGTGVPRDLVQAHAWLSISLAGGQATAAERLAAVEPHLSPAELTRARERARAWLDQHRKTPARPRP